MSPIRVETTVTDDHVTYYLNTVIRCSPDGQVSILLDQPHIADYYTTAPGRAVQWTVHFDETHNHYYGCIHFHNSVIWDIPMMFTSAQDANRVSAAIFNKLI